jgi:endonuclease/exonuclease/phosphatase family metal-dependent hydrolase
LRLTVADWNLDGFTELGAKLELLRDLAWDVLLLQEVTASTWEPLRDLGDAAAWSAGHLPELAAPPRYHSAVVVRGGWRLADTGTVPDVPSPERTATAMIARDGFRCAVASLALPPSATWGIAGKGRQAELLACWLRDRAAPTIVGIDANTPKWDRPRLAECEWWNEQEQLLLGAERVHDLRDAYRDVLRRDPDRRASILERWPDGPLAVSYVRGTGRNRTASRYDHLLVSPDFDVHDVRYLWDEAVEAGSDHALVVADLQVR